MQRETMPLKEIIRQVASDLALGDDHSATTIRCAINDYLDRYEREGYKVNHAYDQPRAVKQVQKLLRAGRTAKELTRGY